MKTAMRATLALAICIVLAFGLAACGGGGGGSDNQDNGDNTAPLSDAGTNRDVTTGDSVTLSGGGTDADGDTLTYEWSFTSVPGGSSITDDDLSDTTAKNPTFTPDVDGEYVLSLVVNDGTVNSTADTVTITSTSTTNVGGNTAPVANAGDNQGVATGNLVTLNGSGTDADGDTLTYEWSFTTNPGSATLSDPTAASPTFTPTVDGTYVLSLVVNDGTADSAADTVTITSTSTTNVGGNTAPVANAGDDQSVATGDSVKVSGWSSSDDDGDYLTYEWSFVQMAEGSALTGSDLSWANMATASFTPDVDGIYILQLIVNDGTVDSEPDTVTITALFTADAGFDSSVSTGETVTLDGSNSPDSGHSVLTYSWSFTMLPEGSTASLSDPAAVDPTFVADLEGPYIVSLTVNDGTADSAADTVVVTAAAPMSFTDNGNSTVTDNLTGLMWQKGEYKSTLNWYEASGTYDATYNPSSTSTCGELTVGGYDDWRLPTKKELISIVDYTAGEPAVDTTYFPMSGYDSYYASFFWTATSNGYDYAWVVFPYGDVDTMSEADDIYYHYIRCVRGAELPVQSFTDNGNGTVGDNNTGLVWQKCSAGQDDYSTCSGTAALMGWEAALEYCSGLELGGQTDWRLPDIKELVSVTDDSSYLVIDTGYFPNTEDYQYWSATSNYYTATVDNAWYLDFTYGDVDEDDKVVHNYVRCVR